MPPAASDACAIRDFVRWNSGDRTVIECSLDEFARVHARAISRLRALRSVPMPKKIEIAAAPTVAGSRYPAPYDEACKCRFRRLLGDAAGLTQFGVNLTCLPPGTWSSQRHWHTVEDKFIFVVEGTVVLVTDSGEELLNAGDCAGFKAGSADGHHLQNRSDRDALILEVGSRYPNEDEAFYPDIDLHALKGRADYAHKDGTLYSGTKPRNPATGK